MPLAVGLFFLLFALPSSVLAALAVRDFLMRGLVPDAARLRCASRLLLLAGALPFALVVLTALGTQGAPLRNPRGFVFLGYGIACLALGVGGGWLFRRAAADPRRVWSKAAETAPMVLILLDFALVVDAAAAP